MKSRLVRSHFGMWLVAAILAAGFGCRARGKLPAGASDRISTVVSAISTLTLQALYKNGDAAAPNDNQIKPFFKIKNTGSTSIALSTLTVRYWYTIESGSPEQVSVDYAQMGNSSVSGTTTRMLTPATGADHFLDVSFSAAAGSLAAGATTGEIQMRVNKTDWTIYNEPDDYSYQTSTTYVTSSKVTIYWNGMLVWGTEPTPIRDCDVGVRMRVLYVAGDPTMPADNQIKPHVQLVNTGFADIPLKEVKIRYWFTQETSSPEQGWIDYAQIGASKITLTFVSPPLPVANADRYLEVGFADNAGTLLAGATTGEMQLRFNKTDWSNYTETNDASYDGSHSEYQPSMNVTAYRNGMLLWGNEPTPSAPVPGQSIFVAGTLTRASDGTTTSTMGTQAFTSPTPFVFPSTMPVSEGNLGNQTASMVLTTSTGTISCTYRGGASIPSPTTADDIALGRVAAFTDCDQACPAIGSILFVTKIALSVAGADPSQSRTTVVLNVGSDNEPRTPLTPIATDDPSFHDTGDPSPPAEPGVIPEAHLPPPPITVHPPMNLAADFTTNPLEANYVDTVDPDVVVAE